MSLKQLIKHIKENDIDAAKALIEYGTKINKTNNNGDTALHLACEKNNLAVVQELIKQRARTDKKNKDGQTALSIAKIIKNKDIKRELRFNFSVIGCTYALFKQVSPSKKNIDILNIHTQHPKTTNTI